MFRSSIASTFPHLHTAGGFAHRVVCPTTCPYVPEDGITLSSRWQRKEGAQSDRPALSLDDAAAAKSKGIIYIIVHISHCLPCVLPHSTKQDIFGCPQDQEGTEGSYDDCMHIARYTHSFGNDNSKRIGVVSGVLAVSWRFPGGFWRMSGKGRFWVPWRFPGGSLAVPWRFPGGFLAVSWRMSGA